MKKLLIMLLAIMALSAGCGSVAEENMTFETKVLSFEIEDNDGSPRYNAIVEVKNTGDTPIHLGWTPFSVTDSNNNLIATESSSVIYAQPSIVYPGEVGYYFAARIDLPAGVSSKESYNLVYETDSIKPANTAGVKDYEVVNVSFPENDYTEIIGEIVNGSDTGDYDVICICYDESGEIITIGGTMGELSASHNTYFDIYNMAAFGKDNITNYKVIARTRNYN